GSAVASASTADSLISGTRRTKPSSDESAITTPAPDKVAGTLVWSAAMPQNQLPTATPPATALWKAARVRPATQRGAESCTATFNWVMESVQAAPVASSAATVSAG